MFTAVAERLDYVGVLALEFFDVKVHCWLTVHHVFITRPLDTAKALKLVQFENTYVLCVVCLH